MLESKKISWREISNVLHRRLLIEIIVALVVLVGGFFVLHLGRATPTAAPKYTATSQVLLTLPESKQQVVLDQTVNPQYVTTFADVVGTDLIARPARTKLAQQGIKLSLSALEKMVDAHTNNNNSLIEINVTTDKRVTAKQIAQVYAQVASQNVKPIMGLGRGKVVTQPRVNQVLAIQKLPIKRIAILVIAAIILGLASGCVVEILDRRIRSRYFVASTLAATPLILTQQPTAIELATVRNTLDIATPHAQILVAQLPNASSELTAAVQALAQQYAAAGDRVLLVDLATDTAMLQQFAVATTPADYQGGTVARLPQSPATPTLLTLAEFERSLARLKGDFQRIIFVAAGAEIVGNQQLALHLAAARLLLLQQGVTTKKAAYQLQQQSQSTTPVNVVLYFGN
ncbi:YveK family protein [Loigolactobacillus zhaoyuanensis]|uniref:Capsular polysaccharide biosynthesis protein n=1 Tax=Loigolactobacillus zhaoyuanensis TaxID=2486017 RepID=A0ABW8U9D7_9LACO